MFYIFGFSCIVRLWVTLINTMQKHTHRQSSLFSHTFCQGKVFPVMRLIWFLGQTHRFKSPWPSLSPCCSPTPWSRLHLYFSWSTFDFTFPWSFLQLLQLVGIPPISDGSWHLRFISNKLRFFVSLSVLALSAAAHSLIISELPQVSSQTVSSEARVDFKVRQMYLHLGAPPLSSHGNGLNDSRSFPLFLHRTETEEFYGVSTREYLKWDSGTVLGITRHF